MIIISNKYFTFFIYLVFVYVIEKKLYIMLFSQRYEIFISDYFNYLNNW